jgi:patatin-like phospholipase/acyl hydrolase
VLRSRDARADPDDDFKITDVICGACAAPSYFPAGRLTSKLGSERLVVDGGIYVNNPTVLALAEHPNRRATMVVSLGTGNAKVAPSHERVLGLDRSWYGMRDLITMAMDGTSELADDQARAILRDRYERFDPALAKNSERLDDASSENLQALKRVAQEVVASSRPRLKRTIDALTRTGDEAHET